MGQEKNSDGSNSGLVKKNKRNQERDAKRLERENKQKEEIAKRRKANRIIGFTVSIVILALLVVPAVIKANANSLASVKSYTKLARNHVMTKVVYPQTPPVGGNHSPVWLNCGVYTQAVPNENAVHSMEHGAVWITYDPNVINGTNLVILQKEMPQSYAVLSPYPGIPSPLVATAWGKQLLLKKVNDPRLIKFIELYANSPKAPEPGGECSGGLNGPGRIA